MHEMQKTLRRKWSPVILFGLCALVVLLADQGSKAWVIRNIPRQPHAGHLFLVEPYARVVADGVLAFIHTGNTGSAFSLFQEHPIILTFLAGLLSLGVCLWAVWWVPPGSLLTRVALGLILGGALGNLIDRVFRDYEVTDFILVLINWKGRYWPTFNVADTAICVGIGLYLIGNWREARAEGRARSAEPGADSLSSGSGE